MKKKATSSSDTSVNIHQSTLHHIADSLSQ